MTRFLAGICGRCSRPVLLLLPLVLLPPAAAVPAAAHPHVWVSVETAIVYEGGRLSGLRYRWTFDEMYTAMAIQGLDTNNDGTYSREELTELAAVNIDGLEEFGYFTAAKLGETPLKFSKPAEYWLEYAGGILSLHFMLPFAEPLLSDAEGFSVSVYDPSYFIAFDLAKDNPVTLGEGAPLGCRPEIGVPKEDTADVQRLGEAFFSQLGGANFGVSLAKTISISCPRS